MAEERTSWLLARFKEEFSTQKLDEGSSQKGNLSSL